MIPTDDLIGKPWQRGARGPASYDCWGLVMELSRRAGRIIPIDWDSRDMTRAEQRALMAGQAAERTARLIGPVDGAIAYSERASHCGFVLHGRVIHAMHGAGVVAWRLPVWGDAFPDTGFYAWRA